MRSAAAGRRRQRGGASQPRADACAASARSRQRSASGVPPPPIAATKGRRRLPCRWACAPRKGAVGPWPPLTWGSCSPARFRWRCACAAAGWRSCRPWSTAGQEAEQEQQSRNRAGASKSRPPAAHAPGGARPPSIQQQPLRAARFKQKAIASPPCNRNQPRTCSAATPPVSSVSLERCASAGAASVAVRHSPAVNLALAAGVPSRSTRCMRDQGPCRRAGGAGGEGGGQGGWAGATRVPAAERRRLPPARGPFGCFCAAAPPACSAHTPAAQAAGRPAGAAHHLGVHQEAPQHPAPAGVRVQAVVVLGRNLAQLRLTVGGGARAAGESAGRTAARLAARTPACPAAAPTAAPPPPRLRPAPPPRPPHLVQARLRDLREIVVLVVVAHVVGQQVQGAVVAAGRARRGAGGAESVNAGW